MPKAHISNRVRILRENAGMTQSALARKCLCSRQTIIMLEQERYVPSLSLAFEIARVFGVKIEDAFELMSGAGDHA